MKLLITVHCLTIILSFVESQDAVVTQLTEPIQLAEGPFWDDVYQKLYFVDIDGKTVHRLDPFTREEQVLHLDRTPSFIIPVVDQQFQFILSLGRDLVLLTWDYRTGAYSTCLLVELDSHRRDNRLNEAKADAYGRVWLVQPWGMPRRAFGTFKRKKGSFRTPTRCMYANFSLIKSWLIGKGTKGPEDENNLSPANEAAFYCVDLTPQNSTVEKAIDQVSISNGLVWSLDNKFLYYIDTPTGQVDVFDFDLEGGTISGKRTLFTLNEHELHGVPDGLNIDSEGNLYLTVNGGGQVIKYNPSTGKILQKIHFPVSHVTSVEFGGPNLDILFVTTMKSKTSRRKSEPEAGAIFTVTGLNVTGLPSNRATIKSFNSYT